MIIIHLYFSPFLSRTHISHLHLAQNTAAKLLTKSSERSHITPILMSLRWLDIKFRIQCKILVTMFKALHVQTADHIKEPPLPYNTSRSLSSSDQG